ncbi:MAG: uracil-DNA glycosylase [Acidobacteria bacterium]|nr:uracil-DNA glycosylase [Acidobacteriota bacterium]
MDPKDELKELIDQTTEHLRYFRDLGVTHIGEATQTEMPKKKIELTSLFGGAEPIPVEQQYAGETLEDIRRDLGDCRRCKLWSTRKNIVFGEGNPKAGLMFVGEGPGADEDASGRPFVGRAGQLLTKMIEAMGFKREEVYIANTPEKEELKPASRFYSARSLSSGPKSSPHWGNPAQQSLLNSSIGITRMRGQFHDYPRIPGIKVMPTYHPAYLLRSPDKKRETWEDLKLVRDFLNE